MDCCSTKYVCGYLHTNYISTDTERIVRDTLKKGVLLLAVLHSQVLLYRTADANGHLSCVSSVFLHFTPGCFSYCTLGGTVELKNSS